MTIKKEDILNKHSSILEVLGRDYMAIGLLNLSSGTLIAVKPDNYRFSGMPDTASSNIDYEIMRQNSISRYIPADTRQHFAAATSLEVIAAELSENIEYSITCQSVILEKQHTCQVRYVRLDEPEYALITFRLADEDASLSENAQISRLTEEIAAARQETKRDKEVLRRNLEELKKERTFLDVLCQDYTSVYFYDLKTDLMEILKLSPGANAFKVIGADALNRHKVVYSEMLRDYCDNFVADAYQHEFINVMNRDSIIKKLSASPRFVYKYQSSANALNHIYFEAQVVRIDADELEDTAIIAVRHIDDILTAEQEHQRQLREALQKEKISNEILAALGKIYYSIYRIDLDADIYEEISSSGELHYLTGKQGKASVELIRICRSIVVPEYQKRILQFFDIATLPDRLHDEETIAEEYLARDGNWHTARFIVKRRSDTGRVTHVLYVTRLISDSKRREQNWIAIAQEANKANEAKTNFLRHMSHDIRTPINGILGMIEAADRYKHDTKKLYECRQKVLNSVEYLLSIVNNVLDIGKLESGEIVLESKPFDISEILSEITPFIEMQAEENQLIYSLDNEAISSIKHRRLIGSPIHIKRMLMNLASNALKYTKAGGSVHLSCEEIQNDDNTAVLRFVCADTGIGMSSEFQKRVFEPYSQEGKPGNSGYSGSGLGLSIVKEIVNQMNGTIEFESKENVGTTFTVTIPFVIDKTAETQCESSEVSNDIDLTGRKALLVEDNALNREIAQMLLEDYGLIITTAQNGKEAVDIFAASNVYTYDFIIMDIMMPVMDGLEATRCIRAMDRADAKSVPILAMTANAFQDDIQQSLEAGMNTHLMKPIDTAKLKQELQRFARACDCSK